MIFWPSSSWSLWQWPSLAEPLFSILNVGRIFLMCTEDIFYNKGTIHPSYGQKSYENATSCEAHYFIFTVGVLIGWTTNAGFTLQHRISISSSYQQCILWWWWLSGIFLTGITSASLTTTPAVEQTSITSFQRSTIITEHWTIHIFFIVFNIDTITINHLWHHHHYHENSSWTIHILFIIINDDNNPNHHHYQQNGHQHYYNHDDDDDEQVECLQLCPPKRFTGHEQRCEKLRERGNCTNKQVVYM